MVIVRITVLYYCNSKNDSKINVDIDRAGGGAGG
jgi:hypothetical protein